MKSIDINLIDDLAGTKLGPGDKFKMYCHSGLACFNQCCHNLNLFLYPYDLIRLKNCLQISSMEFLDQYVEAVLRPHEFFPEVLLNMQEDTAKSCVFLSAQGCEVYHDRPHTCRMFPLEQGLKAEGSVYFVKPMDFCLGVEGEKTWTPQTWIKDQDAQVYQQMTMEWALIRHLLENNPFGKEGSEGSRAKMTFMAVYNIDAFREFILQSTFLKRFKVKSKLLKKIKKNDYELLKLALDWVKFYLWGISSKQFTPQY